MVLSLVGVSQGLKVRKEDVLHTDRVSPSTHGVLHSIQGLTCISIIHVVTTAYL